MPSLASKPLIAVSLAIPSAILLGYLWQKKKAEAEQRVISSAAVEHTAVDSKEVSLKLESLTRSRLDCIEEETVEEKVVQVNAALETQIDSAMTVEEAEISSPAKVSNVQEVFASDKESVACNLSTSPVKSESSESQRSSEAWSDLIEQDEQEILEENLTAKLSNHNVGDGTRHDSGVASPSEEFGGIEGTSRKDLEDKSRISSGEDHGIGGSETGDASDSGQGSELCIEDTQLLSYHFHIQDYLCGTFIGAGGSSINKFKSSCNCNITLKDNKSGSNQKRTKSKSRDKRHYGEGNLNLCIIEGTRTNIDKCLDAIKEKFYKYPELTLEQVNKPENTNLSLYNGSVTLSLAEGIMHDVFISSVVNGGHIFIQQPAHPTFPALERLDACMLNTYSQLTCPELTRPIIPNSICVASNNGGWYRCQVVYYDESEDLCDIKYIDYGGYDTVPADSLRQIRTDFLTLPFQAIECYLANLIITEEDTISSSILEELVAGQNVQARMIGLNEEGVPMIHLYRSCNGQTVMVNRELVDRSCGDWIEATIVPLMPDLDVANWNTSGYFNPSNQANVRQIKHFENLMWNCPLNPVHLVHTPGPYKLPKPPGDPSYSLHIECTSHQNSAVLPDAEFATQGPKISLPPLIPSPCPLQNNGLDLLHQPVGPGSTSFYGPVGASSANWSHPINFLSRGSELGADFVSCSPGVFLEPYPLFGLGPGSSATYIQWSNHEYSMP